eukprot:403361472
MQSWLSTTGYCCDKSNTADQCSSSRYLCSDTAPNLPMRLNFCPFQQNLCYDKAQNTLTDNSKHTAATSNFFGNNNVCAWKIKTITDYYFNKKIIVEIKEANFISCYVAYGESMLKADNYQSCSVGQKIEIDADQHVFVVAQGLSAAAHFQFDYYMADKINLMWLSLIFSLSLFGLLAIIAGLMIYLTARWTGSLVSQNKVFWQKMAVEMCAIVHQAEKLRNPSHTPSHSKTSYNDITQGNVSSQSPLTKPNNQFEYGRKPYGSNTNLNDEVMSLPPPINEPMRSVDYNQQPQRAGSRPQPIRFNL